MLRKGLLFLLILLSLNLNGLGIWANTPQTGKILAIILFVATFFALTLWIGKWVKAILPAGVLYLLLFPYKLEIVLPTLIALLIVFAAAKGKVNVRFAKVVAFVVLTLAYLQLGISHLPVLWNIATSVVTTITSNLVLTAPLDISLCGWVALLFSSSVILLSGNPLRKIAKNLATVFAVHLAILNIIAWALIEVPMIALQSLWLYPLGQWLVLLTFPLQISEAAHFELSSIFRKMAIPFACLFWGMCIIFTAMYPPQRIAIDNPSVALVNSGVMVDFTSKPPVHEPFGFGAAPVFSMVPKYLAAFGFKVDIVPSLEEVEWQHTNIVVLVNFNEELTPVVYEKVASFVREGGALCILGDHTDMEGIATQMNALTAGMGITLNDDTADPILLHRRKLWTNALEFHDNLLTHGFKNHSDVQIWGGASLSLKPGAIPVVSGKYGFSDAADPLHLGFGGRIGNRRLERGEKAGDVVLVAVSNYGEGRLLVFGDTSPFQLPSISSSWLFLNRLFWWLASEDVVGSVTTLKLSGYFLGLLILLIMLFTKANASIGALLISFVIAIPLSYSINSALSRSYDSQILDRMNKENLALINTSLGEQMDLAILSSNSAMGLAYNLMRCGYVPVFGCYGTIKQPRMIFVVAPTKRITEAKAKDLINYVENGGILFLAAGWETRDIINNLLRHFELSIDPVMLGPVPWRHPLLPETLAIEEPDFKEAWPIKILNPESTIPFYIFKNYILTTITKKGEGSFVLISDHRFFIGENLEEERTGNPRNVKFFRELILEVTGNDDY